MSKYKKGIVEDIKKEKVFEENQQHLKDKYNMTGEAVVIVEKNNLLKYLIKYGVALIRLVVTIAILVLATLGVLTIVYTQKLSTLSHELGHALCTDGLSEDSTAKKELIADAVSIMIQSNFGVEITDSRKRHLKSHYDTLKKEMESQLGREMSPEEMGGQLNEILSDTFGVYKEHIEDINKCVELYVPQERLREYEQDKQHREDYNKIRKMDIDRSPEINKFKEIELELEA